MRKILAATLQFGLVFTLVVSCGSGSDPIPPLCGNSALDGSEQCDDGNNISGDGCSASCKIEGNNGQAVCGNGILEIEEDCDLGDQNSDQSSCTSHCKAAVCGDGMVQQGVEECDDGNTLSGDGCDAACKIAFIRHVISNQSSNAKDVYVADLDGDSKTDILSASAEDGKIAWFKGDGAGNFSAEKIISNQAVDVAAVYAVDLDGDSKLDVLAAIYDRIVWFQNNGNGTFSAEKVILSEQGILTVYAADLDNDGDMDVLSGSMIDEVAWYKNDGNGNFGNKSIIAQVNFDPTSIYAANLDGDNNIDLLVTTRSNKVLWYKNNGNGVFGNENVIASGSGIVEFPDVYPADLDGDGKLDVLSTSPDVAQITWYEGNGSGGFSIGETIGELDYYPNRIYTADLDNDGKLDLLFLGNIEVAWFRSNGDGTFNNKKTIANLDGGGFRGGIFAADLDGDQDLDVVVTESGSNTVAWYENVLNKFK